jgi:hypothetical protein
MKDGMAVVIYPDSGWGSGSDICRVIQPML